MKKMVKAGGIWALAIVAMLVLLILPVQAANTIKRTGDVVEVTFDGSTALNFTTDSTINLPRGGILYSIEAIPAAVNGEATVRLESVTGTKIFYDKSTSGGPGMAYYPGILARLYIKGTEVANGSQMIVVIKNRP